MDAATLALLMYLDEGLVKNLSSLYLSGYINIRTTKLIQDRSLTGKVGFDNRERNYGEDRSFEEERQGFRNNNCTVLDTFDFTNTTSGNIEDKGYLRREEEFQRIYTSFSLHSEIYTSLESQNIVKTFDDRTINDGEVSEGDYVKIYGNLTTENVNSYLDTLLTAFNCYGCDNLNKMVSFKDKELMNFSTMNNILTHLNDILNKNSTEDMILTCGDTPIVVNVNDNYFMNNNSYIFDKVECPCTIFGKVIKVAPCGDSVNLLRKTAQENFYEQVLNRCISYCDLLNSNGIIMPKMPRLKCAGISLVVVPVSIQM
ncbi:hypothetical protein SAMN04487886_110114 [Clostridium sp. DSM 8431]|uniref:DUF6414 family protein n=1 Tax=Clostridium sp. DSM 8431 TaxID=1761781 RepID=UPI0008F26D7A|nr:hypothetical protein [Clostridium sp. DSM 8431]SFU68468.1 hypothetical protein SAMN04487886_110114 [Clostridium sp. DSM 8431]